MAYTEQQKATLLSMLENNLSLVFDYMDAESALEKRTQLGYYIDAAIEFIEREGITLDYQKVGDLQIVTMYAAYLYEKRNDGVSVMPRILRYNLNTRVFQEKVNKDAG